MLKIPEILKPKKPDITGNIYLTHAWQLSSSVIVMSLIGYWIDKEYNTSPVWVLILSIAGIVSGLYSFIKAVLDEEKRRKNKSK
jgi:F0F1-type ATP synthase assembly protein I